MCAQRIPVSGQDSFSFSENKAPAGYQFVLIESDRIVSQIDVEASLLASHGQMFVKYYLGSGTLSDYPWQRFLLTLLSVSLKRVIIISWVIARIGHVIMFNVEHMTA